MDEKRWTATELVELAGQHGYEVTARQLERWHKADVLPRPVQDAHAPKGTWSYYPSGTDAYLLAACRLRAAGKGRPLWRLRFELWWAGFPIPLDKARESLVLLLDPVHAQLHDEAAVERAREDLAGIEQKQTRRGLAAHTRQALRSRLYEAVDLMTLILDLLTGQPRAIDAPIEHARNKRIFADALADVLTFDGTRETTASAMEDVIRSGGIVEALTEATGIAGQDPQEVLAGIADVRLLAARHAAAVLQTALLVIAKALRRLKAHDVAVLRLVRQAERETGHPRARAELVLLFARTAAFDLATIRQASAMFEATGRRYGTMLRVLEAIPESRILDNGLEAFEALPAAERDTLTERVQAFLKMHPEIADALEER